MPIIMYDSINVSALPRSAQADAGYVDGAWPTFSHLPPAQYHLSIAVFASDNADCLDVESGDAVNSQAPGWWRKAMGNHYLYTSASNAQALINTMAGAGVARDRYKLWTAHYTFAQHICGPGTCGYPQADATQYTDNAGANLDASLCADDFFATAPAPAPAPVPAPPLEDPMSVRLDPGSTSAPVCVSFDGAPYHTIGFLADPSVVGAAVTTVRVAEHVGGGGAEFKVTQVAMTKDSPKTVLVLQASTDGVTFSRSDDVNVVLYPNFA